jgi:hypothetical protein
MSMPKEYAKIYHERFKADRPTVVVACYTCASGKTERGNKKVCNGCYGIPGRPNWHKRAVSKHAENGLPLERGIRIVTRRTARPGNGQE